MKLPDSNLAFPAGAGSSVMCPDTDFQVSIVAVAAISPGHRNGCATWPNVRT